MGVSGLTIVDTFGDPILLHLVRYRLESEGIESFTENEHGLNLYAIYRNTTWGGVAVSVPSEHAARAREIINEIRNEVRDNHDAIHLRCPACESDNTYPVPKDESPKFGIAGFIHGVRNLFASPKLHCKDCGHRW